MKLEEKKEVKEESINDFKPRKWLLIVLILIAICISVVLISKVIEIHNKNKDNSIFSNLFKEKEDDFDANFFNTKFEFHKGSQSYDSTCDLLDEIITNNKKNKNHLITVVYNNYNTSIIEELNKIKGEMTPNKKYEVSLDYDEKKYVNRITLVGSVDKNSLELFSFNSSFEMYNGDEMGTSVNWLLDKVISCNKKDRNHLVSVVYGSHNTTNVEELESIKKEINTWSKYNVSLDYNDEGYVSVITIK